MHYTSKMLMAVLDDDVTGHEAAKKALIVMLNRSRVRCHQKYVKLMDNDLLIKPLKLLLIGASGTGKTHLVTTLSKVCCVPLIKVDATDLVPTGGSGGIKSEKLYKMIEEEALVMAKMYPKLYPYIEYAIEHAIVYVDEIDKLGTSFESSGNWNKHVQSNFLTLFDNKEEFAGVSFIFSGAFADITKEKPVAKKLGFTHHVDDHHDHEESVLLDQQILKAGIIPELLGRINMIVELDKFNIEDYKGIIKDRIIPKKAIDLMALGCPELELSEEDVLFIATKAAKSGQGVRYAQREVDRICLEHEFNSDAKLMISYKIPEEDNEGELDNVTDFII